MTQKIGRVGAENGVSGVIALEFWCAYFLPITILSFLHFGKSAQTD